MFSNKFSPIILHIAYYSVLNNKLRYGSLIKNAVNIEVQIEYKSGDFSTVCKKVLQSYSMI